MVKERETGKKKQYVCEACGFVYRTKVYAQECENFCHTHKGCSLEITKHALPMKGGET